jgi:hypothetical protein
MCQYKLYSLWFDQIVDRNHDLPHMMRVLITISSQERYCLLCLSVLFLWNRYTHFCIYAKQKMHYVQINNMVIDI